MCQDHSKWQGENMQVLGRNLNNLQSRRKSTFANISKKDLCSPFYRAVEIRILYEY